MLRQFWFCFVLVGGCVGECRRLWHPDIDVIDRVWGQQSLLQGDDIIAGSNYYWRIVLGYKNTMAAWVLLLIHSINLRSSLFEEWLLRNDRLVVQIAIKSKEGGKNSQISTEEVMGDTLTNKQVDFDRIYS